MSDYINCYQSVVYNTIQNEGEPEERQFEKVNKCFQTAKVFFGMFYLSLMERR